MKVSIEISDKRIHDLIHGHGLTYSYSWWDEISGNALSKKGAKVVFTRESDEEGEFGGKRLIKAHAVRNGLELMARLSSEAWADFMAENDDMETCDTAWQYIVFGKLVYG